MFLHWQLPVEQAKAAIEIDCGAIINQETNTDIEALLGTPDNLVSNSKGQFYQYSVNHGEEFCSYEIDRQKRLLAVTRLQTL